MIEAGLALGDLSGLIAETEMQEIDRMKWEQWLIRGHDRYGNPISYEIFWGKPYGRRN